MLGKRLLPLLAHPLLPHLESECSPRKEAKPLLVLVVVLAVSGLVVSRLHKMFASQDLNANAVGNVVDNVIDHDGADQLFRPGCERASAQRTLAG